MSRDKIDLLVTFDKNYIRPFRTMLKSLVANNPRDNFHVWLLHSAIPTAHLQDLEAYCNLQGITLTPVQVDRRLFGSAPISKQYPQEMYYRLLAPHLLPPTLKKVLYLDPDILVINSLRPLWDTALGEYTFAAAAHVGLVGIWNEINRARLWGLKSDYYNSGVMLMDLEKARSLVKSEDIFACVSKHEAELILPDQDVFNILYGAHTLPLEDAIWNYDAQYYSQYLARSNGEYHLEWMMKHTVILHFCGKRKPWKKTYMGRLAGLYQYFMQAAERVTELD